MIRSRILKDPGRDWDLSDPEQSRALDTLVDAHYNWTNSSPYRSLWFPLGKKASLSPLKMLELVRFENGQMLEYNVDLIRKKMVPGEGIHVVGTGANLVVAAVIKSELYQKGSYPFVHVSAADLGIWLDPKEQLPLIDPGTTLCVDLTTDSDDGKLFADRSLRLHGILKLNRGPLILLSPKTTKAPGVIRKSIYDLYPNISTVAVVMRKS